jgi:hypothetical protein
MANPKRLSIIRSRTSPLSSAPVVDAHESASGSRQSGLESDAYRSQNLVSLRIHGRSLRASSTCIRSPPRCYPDLSSDFLRPGLIKFPSRRGEKFIFLLMRMLPNKAAEFVYSFQPLIIVGRQVRDLLKSGLEV